MAQADGTIQNDTGSNVRSDLNNNFAACFTNNSGSSAPSTTFANQWWADTGNGLLKIRNTSNTSFITVGTLDNTNLGLAPQASPTFTGNVTIPAGTVSLPSLRFSGDNDTGLYSSSGNNVNITAGGTLCHTFTNSYSTASVPIRVPDGTAAAPSITNTGDENTGIFFGAADEVSITTGGTERAQFDSNGLSVLAQKSVRYYDADNSHYVELKAASTVSANVTLTLPTSDGDADQFLKTDGSGNLSFASIGSGSLVPTASVFALATSTVPSGYLECDGAAVSRTTYADLFAAIGTTYGAGNGASTFNVPDLRGEFIRGWDNGRGIDSSRTLGSTQSDDNKSHTHTITDPGHNHQVNINVYQQGAGPNAQTDMANRAGNTTSSTAFTGISLAASGGTESRPRNVAMMYVIKT
jgi:microcystin-dependent protein